MLLPRRGQIEGHTIEFQSHRAELVVMLNSGHPFRAALVQEHLRQTGGAALHHPVQVGNTLPRTAMALVKQQIPHHATHKGQPWQACFDGCRLQGIQQC